MESMEAADNLILIFQILYVVTALGTMIIVISENRNPLKTISWVLILLLLPLVGLIIYYFFGEDSRKQRLISHKMYKKLNRRSIGRKELLETLNPPAEHRGLVNLLNRLKGAPLYGGSNVTFYSDGIAKFYALFEELEKAKKHIHIQYYIFLDDEIGRKTCDILVRKAAEGVEVRLIYDDVGSWKAKRRFFKEMQGQGIEVQPFLKVAFKFLTSRVNYRNHRKIVVIDGKIGFVGGMNIADRYINGVSFGTWRDSHIKIEGKAVAGLQTSFLIDWYSSRKEFLASDTYYPVLESKGDNLIQLVTSGPVGPFKDIHLGILQAISTAKECIYIQTPYFVPTDALLLALQMASMRGVDVRLMLPRHSDTTFVHIASMSYLKDVLDAKVSVFFYEAGFLHSKLMVIDGSLTITGSANMDVRSFEHNFEIDAFIYNENTCDAAKDIFFRDMEQSSLLSAEEWEKRSRFEKFKESVMRLFSPLL
ncbi:MULTISPECIES: cardiolipin synthase [unclassified Dysgonomonas]|jgi:cardiolipin synthase|uniref:cardiolipin synthase n=1 Tax=unclassified Dysgonomonas TaxID=2630389 RepID=UPI0025B9F506|nr:MULTISPECIES: cardiolipin synthase [unclassified Dysgonomonas]MDR2005548.1 cardiolipin synthase [Prevotella sp.]HMM01495.1 cardiolipin synthase [Dysgonomonas sp.]